MTVNGHQKALTKNKKRSACLEDSRQRYSVSGEISMIEGMEYRHTSASNWGGENAMQRGHWLQED